MNNLIEVKFISSKKGKGVFAKGFIKKGTIIDIAHVILISDNDYELIEKTILYNYSFTWNDPNNNSEYKNAIPLSVCQLINHSYNPNLVNEYDYEKKYITYKAIRDISRGEELTINYNGIVEDKSPVWFEVE